MAVHKLSLIERKCDEPCVPDPAECREHFAAGRLPVYYGRQLVAYVDAPEDLPIARFVERDGRLAGMHGYEQILAREIRDGLRALA